MRRLQSIQTCYCCSSSGSPTRITYGRISGFQDDYGEDEFLIVERTVGKYDSIVLIPHIVAEVSTLIPFIGEPGRSAIRRALKSLVESMPEIAVSSRSAVRRRESDYLGVTDAALLHLCSMPLGSVRPTLFTADGPLSSGARALGYSVINFREILGRS